MPSTFFAVLAEFGEASIPLEKVAAKYFGLSAKEAKRQASMNRLPIPTFRVGRQKSPVLISAIDLAAWIDKQRENATTEWKKSQTETARRIPAPASPGVYTVSARPKNRAGYAPRPQEW